ncbi:hypothetical protein J3R82DRAFT_5912 [Butyriboletus roseoflavus]|nr:hypothetical protein J3R82DRAFT_5912 [Butyriboletus roseoflavus]
MPAILAPSPRHPPQHLHLSAQDSLSSTLVRPCPLLCPLSSYDPQRTIHPRTFFPPPRLLSPIRLHDPPYVALSSKSPTPCGPPHKRRASSRLLARSTRRRRHPQRVDGPLDAFGRTAIFDQLPWISSLEMPRPNNCDIADLSQLPLDADSVTFSDAVPASGPVRRRKSSLRSNPLASGHGVLVDLYVPRKCAATNRLITSKDHASVQINVVDVDSTGRALNTYTSFALCGQVRSQGESDDSLNRLATKAGFWTISTLTATRPMRGGNSHFTSLSVISSGSMVEIKRVSDDDDNTSSPSADEESKYRLLYSKSKVYVNPTAYARDNIPGFVALVKCEQKNGTSLVKIEERAIEDEEDEDAVLIDLPTQRPESYAFSVPLTSIYSLLVHPPTLSSWYGTVGINLINGSTLPTLHFHDDESLSMTLPPRTHNRRNSSNAYPPSASLSTSGAVARPPVSWGGEDLISRLRCYAHLLRSSLQPTLFILDPSKADIEAHSTQLFDDDAVDDILAQSSYANSHSPVPAHRRPRPISTPPSSTINPYSNRASVLHRSLYPPSVSTTQNTSQARLALLQSFSNITRATRHAAQNILSHPLAKPIVPHLPDPVKSLVNANGEWEWGSWVEKGGVGEFESARVYLARWARIVAEEGDRARKREAQALPTSSPDMAEETSSLGVFELLHSTINLPTPKTSREPRNPIDERTWQKWFAADGRPKVRIEEMQREVFRRGIMPTGTLRKKIWPFLLGVHAWDTDAKERKRRWEEKRKRYQEIKNEWCGVPEVFDRQDTLEERHRIDVDCRRTDRAHPLFSYGYEDSSSDPEAERLHRRYSTISPQLADIGAQSPSNEHIDRMGGILLTYNFYDKDLGYVQGMSDLCAPLYVVLDAEEELIFWCFVEVMNRMGQNFLRDQSGMKKQLSTLQELISVMDPELYRHFEKTEGLNLFFCFRWVLIAFKREFPFCDVLRLWEVLWTDYYSNNFVLFVALAILESHRDMILRYLVEFDEILKYCNELSMTIELDSTLAQAEVLFLSYSQFVADIDRRRAEESSRSSSTSALIRRRSTRAFLSYPKFPPLNSMSNLTVLRGYAQKARPETLPPSVLFEHTDKCLTVFDAFPKSIFHFLVLPRVRPPLSVSELANLRTLLKGDKARAKQVLMDLNDVAHTVKKMIREEMQNRYGFQWEIWTGFHAVPSMEHLHLHVLSNDLCSEKMKHKKHYNSFHPELGFFLHLHEVLSWFDEEPSYFERLKKSDYENLLKESLYCWKCERDMKNMPLLKAHLQEEWDDEAGKEKARLARKRKRDDATSVNPDISDDKEPEAKRPSPRVA